MRKICFVLACLAAVAGLLFIRLNHPSIARATTGSLAALWHFDEGAGSSAFDSSGNGNVGVLTSSTVLPTFVPGKFETALKFDGVDDFVQVGDSASLEPSTNITVEMWVNSLIPDRLRIFWQRVQMPAPLAHMHSMSPEATFSFMCWSATAQSFVRLRPLMPACLTATGIMSRVPMMAQACTCS